ncbi:hypothetical protein [Alicyclobacillus sendaiensis]|uniref:hypothetical protein n=1 Tax=Alicyclobacillus sendaiensis TaxID=192387 RepID=UPI0026F40B27|nr:hypothetical protein [Alicyclobacillus sendaiensis]
MSTIEASDVIDRLETLVASAIAKLERAEVNGLIEILAAQCECAKELQGAEIDEANRERLTGLAKRVQLQQRLIEQGLSIASTVLRDIYRGRAFSEFA